MDNHFKQWDYEAPFLKPAYHFEFPIIMCNKAQYFVQSNNLNADSNTLLIWFNMAIQELNTEGYNFRMAKMLPEIVNNEKQKLPFDILERYMSIPQELLEPYIINYIIYRVQITQGWAPPQLKDAIVKLDMFKNNILNSAWIDENYQRDAKVSYNKDLINCRWKYRY